MLPDCLTPYKHYNEETISGVLDGIVNSDDEDSEMIEGDIYTRRHVKIIEMDEIEI